MKAFNTKHGDEYYTPEWVYKPLGVFDADYCASNTSHIALKNYNKSDDGLSMVWNGLVWCNPPFSQKRIWIEKMKQHNNGIMLLPASVSTPWFGDLASHCKQIYFLGKKVNFINGPSSNYGASCLFPFGHEALARLVSCELPGYLVDILKFKAR